MIPALIFGLASLVACTAPPSESGPGASADLDVTVHPEVSTILVARWTQQAATSASWVSYSFGDTRLTTPVIARSAGPAQEVLLGIPADTEVSVEVLDAETEARGGPTRTATTGSLPDDLVLPTVLSWDPASSSPEPWVLVTVDLGEYWYQGPVYALILDRQGRVVWYWELPQHRVSLSAQPGWDGTHLMVDGDATFVFDSTVLPKVYRMTLDLSRLDETEIPDFRFAIDEEDNGAVLYDRRVDGDWRLTRHGADGVDTDIWSCSDFMATLGEDGEECAANTVVWDADRRSALYSMPRNNSVVEVDADTGAVLLRFGDVAGGCGIDPPTSAPYFQHYANWTPDGTLLLSTKVAEEPDAMRAREYAVDAAAQTLSEVWSYSADGAHFAEENGEATRLDNGDTLIGYGTEGALIEVSPAGDVVWDLEWPTRQSDPATYLIGHAALIADLYPLNGEGRSTARGP